MTTPSGSLEPHRGTLILVFGILGLLVCGFFGLAAWIMGNTDLKKIDSGLMDPEGRSNTNVGKILGIIGTIWLCIVIIGLIIAGILISTGLLSLSGSSTSTGYELQP